LRDAIASDAIANINRSRISPVFAVLSWESFKNWLSGTTGLTHNDWHILLGLALTLGFTRVLRRPLGSWLPLLLVLALELINETSDFTRYYVAGWPWEPGPTLVDIALTMAAPLAITIIVRMTSPHFSEATSGAR
jgi:hypothetical protein